MTPTSQIHQQQQVTFSQQLSIGDYLYDSTSTIYLNGYLNWNEILQNKDCRSFKTISLQYCGIDDQRFKDFYRLDLSSLRKLQLCYNKLTIPSLKLIAFESKFKNLTKLQVGNNKISSQGIKILMKSNLLNLRELCLCKTQSGNEGAKHLAKNNFINLIKLNLKQNFIGMSGIISLAENSRNIYKNFQIFDEDGNDDSIANMQLISSKVAHLSLKFGIRNNILRQNLIKIFINQTNYVHQQQ